LTTLNHQKDEEYQNIFENAVEGIFQSSPDGHFIKVNPAMARIYGYESPEEMLESIKNISQQIYVNAKDRKYFLQKLQNNGYVDKFEGKNYRKDGSTFWTQTNARIVRDPDGNALYIEGFLSDITSQKYAEFALKQSEEQFKKIFESNPIASCIATLEEGRYIAANDAYWKLSGFKPDEFLGCTSKELGFLDEQKRSQFVTRLKKEKSIHNEDGKLITKSGEIRNTLEFFEFIVFDSQDCILGMFYDVTDKVNAQQALLDNEEKYRQLYEAESDAIFLIDNESGNILEVNDAATVMYGFSKEELLCKKNSDLSAEPEKTKQVTRSTPIIKEQIISIPIRYHKKKNGTIFPVEITGRFFEWHGRSVHIAAIRDITERKKVEEALKTSEERFRLAFQTSPDSININRLKDGLYIDVNEGFTAITGYTREEVLGKTSNDFNIWENQKDRGLLVDELIANGFVNNQEAKFLTKDGRVVTILMSARIITLDNALHIISISRDIESIKQTETTLQRQLEDLTILHKIAVAASSSKTVDELLQRTTDTIANALHPDNCGVELVTEIGDRYLAHESYRGATKNEIRKPLPLSKGITGKVISTGKPIRLGNVSKDSAYIEVTQGIQSELCVPIKMQNRVIGALNIETKQANAYTESDERLLNTIAGTLATAIEQLRLFESSQLHLQELTILNAVSLASTRAKNPDDLIESVTQIIGESLYPDNFGVLLLNKMKNELTPHPSYRGISNGKFPKSLSLGQGISGQVAATGTPIRIANVRTHKKYIEVTSQIRSELCVPIKLADQVLGVINAESIRINAFTEDDEQLLSTIASTLATAMEKLRLLEEEKKRRQEAEALLDATTTLTTSLELDTLWDLILDILARIISYDSASIALQQNEKLVIVAGKGFPSGYDVLGKELAHSEKWLNLNSSRQAIILPDVHLESSFEQWEGSEYIRSWMGVPMIVHNKLIGFINLDSRDPNTFTEKDAIVAQTFANSAAVAIENARLFQEESRRSQIIEAMAKIANEFATAKEILPALDKIAQRSLELLHASTVAIYLLQDDDKTIKVVTAIGAYREQLYTHTLQIGIGITGNIIASGEPEIIDDMFKDSRRVTVPGTPKEDAQRDTIMSAPLILRGKAIGAINAWRQRSSGLFNESELNFLVTIANQTSMLIESIRLFQETDRRAEEAHAVAEVGKGISSTLQLDNVLERIAQYAKDLLRAETSAVYLSNQEEPLLRAIAAIGIDSNEIKNDPLMLGSGILGNIALQKSGEIVNDTMRDSRAIIVKGTDSNPNEHLMGVPVLSMDKLTGLLAVWRTGEGEEFKPFELDFLNSLAQQAAIAIENARLFEAERRSRERAEILREVTAALTASIELESLYEHILDSVTKLIPFDSTSIGIFEQGYIKIVAGRSSNDYKICLNSKYHYDTSQLESPETLREPIIIQDVRNDNQFEKQKDTEYIRGWMGVPMVVQERLIGFLNFDSTQPNFYTKEHAALAQTFGNQAAIAIENARLFESEQRRHRESETLRQAALAVTTSLELESVLDTILIAMKQVVPYDSASVLMLEGNKLRLTTAQGFSNIEEILNLTFSADDELLQTVRDSREPVILKNAQLDKRFNNWANTDYVRGWMGVPLIIRNEVIGYITFDSRQEDIYNQTFASLTQAFAYQAASAIQNARQYEMEQRHFHEAETLRQAAEAITSTLEIQQVLSSILDNLNRVIPFDSAAVFLLENENVRLTAVKGMPDNEDSIGRLFPASDALLQEISQTKLPLILKDAQNDSRFKKWVADRVRGWIGVPLIARGVIIGYLTIDSLEVGAYSEHDANLAMTFTHQAAVAIENARLYERGEAQIRQLTVLRDIDSAISSSFDLRVTLNLLIGYAIKELNADAVAILLYNPDLKSLSLFTNLGFTRKHNFAVSHIRIGEGPAGRVVLQRKLVHIPNLNSTTDFSLVDYHRDENFGSYFGVPLIAKGQIKGVMELYTREETYPDSDWFNFLKTLAGQAAIAIDSVQLFKNLQRSNQELILAYDTTLAGWGKALELRDKETQGHTDRVVQLTIELARRIGVEGVEMTNIMRGTLLHDIGKMGIPDQILHKPGPLTEAEWEIMRQHPQYAYDLMHPIPYLRPALDIPYAHHERWDGSGYPRGLKGEDIPLSARIFAVVDIWDALLFDRVYREAWPKEKVYEYIKNAAGIELDPDIVETFLEMIQEDEYRNRVE